jgi:hypothetical protein
VYGSHVTRMCHCLYDMQYAGVDLLSPRGCMVRWFELHASIMQSATLMMGSACELM